VEVKENIDKINLWCDSELQVKGLDKLKSDFAGKLIEKMR
jgi:hypothetical protein